MVLGLLGDVLLRAEPGLNAALWVTAVAVALPLTAHYAGVPLSGSGRWLAVPAVLLASAYAWRASPALLMADTLVLAVVLALTAAFSRSGRLAATSMLEYALGAILAGVQTAAGLFQALFGDVEWKSMPRGPFAHRASAVLKGLLIALPLLLIFGALFAAADAVFAELADKLLSSAPENLVSHIFLTGFLAWLAGGFLRTALAGFIPDLSQTEKPERLSLGAVEMGVAMGLVNGLFLAFVLVQARYFFGGSALVEATTGLTYAEYARRGFFELVWVGALVLPLLLLGHWLVPKERPGQMRLFRWMAGALVALVAVVMGSALQRMLLYQDAYGLTELRVYSTAFMGWLGLLFAWFCLTVMREQRNRFAFGALVSGLTVLAALHVANPDGLIVQVNAARLAGGRPFDGAYAASLSADAVPALVAALPNLPEAERAAVVETLLERWSRTEQGDWRSWNLARSRAWQAVEPLRQQAAVAP